MLLDEFFSGNNLIPLEGPLYLKSDSKKGWKKYHFVLRASGLHYYPKDQKTRSAKDLLCLALFAGHEVYRGIGWKKKHKAPTDYTFALRCPKVPPGAKGIRSVKMLCAEDATVLEAWITAIRVTKVSLAVGRLSVLSFKILFIFTVRQKVAGQSSIFNGRFSKGGTR